MKISMTSIQRRGPIGTSRSLAFTLAELLVVVLVLTLLAAVLLPGFAGTSDSRSRALTCINNQRSIMAATLMYAQDHADFLPPNPDDGNTVPGHSWCADRILTYNSSLLASNCLLMPYLRTNVALFRCTADSSVRQSPSNPNLFQPVSRSISLNQAVGTICRQYDVGGGHGGKPVLSVNGPWLDNTHSHRRNNPYRTFGKTSEIISPTPAGLWVLLEEDPKSINDAGFAFGMNNSEWIDFPSTLHEFGCVFSFADGHAALRKWEDSRTLLKGAPIRIQVPGSKDWQWMANRTSARAQ